MIGNTGAGKSSFINYTHGCEFQRVLAASLGGERTLFGRVAVLNSHALAPTGLQHGAEQLLLLCTSFAEGAVCHRSDGKREEESHAGQARHDTGGADEDRPHQRVRNVHPRYVAVLSSGGNLSSTAINGSILDPTTLVCVHSERSPIPAPPVPVLHLLPHIVHIISHVYSNLHMLLPLTASCSAIWTAADIQDALIFGPAEPAVFMDCPGFLDNRGPVINIANAINIKLALTAVASARVVVLIHFHSLTVDRGRGVKELAAMLLDLFGDLDGLQRSCGALLVGISQVPKKDEDGDEITLDEVRAQLTDTSGLPPQHKALVELLSKNVFTFDLLGQGHESWLQQEAIVDRLRQLDRIEQTAEIFNTVLTLEDEHALRSIVEVLFANLRETAMLLLLPLVLEEPIAEVVMFRCTAL